MATKIQLRRDLSSNWASTNPVLAQGEPGVELDTNNMKIGDGVKAWNDLAYTVQESGLQSVFVNTNDYYANAPRISEDGINWTSAVNQGGPGTYHSNRWSVNSIAIGNGLIVYRGYDDIANRAEIRYGTSPYQSAVTPDSDITRRGPNGEDINWNSLSFGGGYFVAGGWYYDEVRNNYRYPIAAYSADGATWTQINIDLDYVKDIVDAQNTAHPTTAGGMRISSVTYGSSGWLFTLNYEQDNTSWNGSNRLNPGAFYITSITTALNSGSYFATMPATDWSAWFDGHGWLAYYNSNLIYRNTAADPRQGSWTDIDWQGVTGGIDFASGFDGPGTGDYYGVDEIAAGDLGGVNYMAISDYYGVVYYTADQGTTWNYVTPGPAYAGITELKRETNGGLQFGNGSTSNVIWGDRPKTDWNGEKVTISGSYVVELNGTWWLDDYAGNSFHLYHDKLKTQPLDTSNFAAYNIVEKYVSYGEKGDSHLVLPDTTNIVVGQRIYGHDAVLTSEDRNGDWKEPNIITAINTDTNTITLQYPLYQRINNQNLYFQALVKYTHGDPLNNLIYGGGKFVATGDDSSRAYFTTNMTDWKYTQYARYNYGWNNGASAYGALDINKNALRNNSEFLPGITNSLSLGDAFDVTVASITDAAQGPYDYYGAEDYGIGRININPGSGLWYLGVRDNARNHTVAIYSYNGYQNPYGNNASTDDYYHATSVRIETANNNFYFDDYYGTFIAPNISIGEDQNNYYDYYGYNHIDDVHFDGQDIYTTDGYELTIYNMFAPVNQGGGVHIHWDDTSHVYVDSDGVTLTQGSFDWMFTDDNSGTVYAPDSSDIDIGGYWTIGQGNGTVGYPYIGPVDNIGPDAYDFVIQAGYRDGDTFNNYWYFNRDGKLTLPPSGHIDVAGFWLIGNDTARIYADDIVNNGEVYDLVLQANTTQWQFLNNGKFKLPAGGDIVNSDDASVLNQDMPQNLQNSGDDYTLQLSDRGKHIYKIDTSGDLLIPTNAAVAFPIGTCVTLVTGTNRPTHIVPVDSGTTTLILSKFGSDNNISVPADTYVTILKIETDKWMIQT
jgi:hypothetical protein